MQSSSVEQMLDMLAEFESQRDGLTAQKSALLNEVKLPEEIQTIVSAGTKRLTDVQSAMRPSLDELEAEVAAQLKKIVVPEEIKAAYAEIERQRSLVAAYRRAKEQEIHERQREAEAKIRAEIDDQTKAAYKALVVRKSEIEAEFGGNLAAVNANIEALKAQIKAATIAAGKTFKGRFFQSIFTKGRITWITDNIDGVYFKLNAILKALDAIATGEGASILDARHELSEAIRSLEGARKEGAPSTQLKRI